MSARKLNRGMQLGILVAGILLLAAPSVGRAAVMVLEWDFGDGAEVEADADVEPAAGATAGADIVGADIVETGDSVDSSAATDSAAGNSAGGKSGDGESVGRTDSKRGDGSSTGDSSSSGSGSTNDNTERNDTASVEEGKQRPQSESQEPTGSPGPSSAGPSGFPGDSGGVGPAEIPDVFKIPAPAGADGVFGDVPPSSGSDGQTPTIVGLDPPPAPTGNLFGDPSLFGDPFGDATNPVPAKPSVASPDSVSLPSLPAGDAGAVGGTLPESFFEHVSSGYAFGSASAESYGSYAEMNQSNSEAPEASSLLIWTVLAIAFCVAAWRRRSRSPRAAV